MNKSLPVYEVYNIQVFAFKVVHDDACHPIDISHVVTCFRCGAICKYDYYKFTTESNSERNLKMSYHLAKLRTRA